MEERLAESLLVRDEIVRHWLLNSTIDFPICLTHLFPAFRWGALNLREIPQCGAEDYARNLLALFDLGMIKFTSELPEDDIITRSGVSGVLERFLALPPDHKHGRYSQRPPEMRVDFELTALGGDTWEKLAEPDWGRFISGFTTPDQNMSEDENQPMTGEGELTSPNRDILLAYMGWYPERNSERIHLETVKWETSTDHEILYWKRLPFVYVVSFKVTSADSRWKYRREPSWFWDWQLDGWYKRPWDLPSWPKE